MPPPWAWIGWPVVSFQAVPGVIAASAAEAGRATRPIPATSTAAETSARRRIAVVPSTLTRFDHTGRAARCQPLVPPADRLTGMDHATGSGCGVATLEFRLRDPDRSLAGVRLVHHVVGIDRVDFSYAAGERAWHLRVPRPALWRLGYLLELRHPDGRTETIPDPDNPHRVGGAFGDKSVLSCPEYHEPDWLHRPAGAGTWRELAVPVPTLGATLTARIRSPQAPSQRILVAHDGPEYDRLAALAHYSAAADVPPHHLVLLDPGERNEWYSANPGYARALVTEVLPRVYTALGTAGPVVGMGASLGALAMLHAQRRHPDAFAGLYLQSGSFFLPRFDRHESGFRRYPPNLRFVGGVGRGARAGRPVPGVLTRGLAEGNPAHNPEMTRNPAPPGYPAR